MESNWHKYPSDDDSLLKDHYFYLVTHKDFGTPMKAKYHSDVEEFEVYIGGINNNEYWQPWDPDNPIIAWMELPDIYKEE